MDEAHVQHAVSLVQHHGLNRIHLHGAALHMVAEAAGGGHHNLRTLFEGVNLLADGLSAVEADAAHAGLESGDIPQLTGDLNGKLPGRSQNDRLYRFILRVNMLHNGDAVCKGFSRPGGSFCDDVLPGHHGRNTAGLNRCGYFQIAVRNGTHNLR